MHALAYPHREQDADRDHGEEIPADERRHGGAVLAVEVEAQIAVGSHAHLEFARPHDDPRHAEDREHQREKAGEDREHLRGDRNTT